LLFFLECSQIGGSLTAGKAIMHLQGKES
jgi:hypothetical protein